MERRVLATESHEGIHQVNGRRNRKWTALAGGFAGLLVAAGLFVGGLSARGQEAGDTAPEAAKPGQLTLLYTVNNLGYMDTCG